MIADNTDYLWAQLADSNARLVDSVGCGCSPTRGSGAGAIGVAGIVALRAVRRRSSRRA